MIVLFRLDDQLYGLPVAAVDRFVPLMKLRPVPHMPEFVAGLFNLEGALVAVLDLASLLVERPSKRVMSTRIVVVEFACMGGKRRLVGLMVEQILALRPVDQSAVEAAPVSSEGAPYLGPVMKDSEGLIQIIEIDRLIPPALQESLFADGGVV